jgi:hypothetical protein
MMPGGPIGYYVTCDDAECAACFQRAGGHANWLAHGGFEDWPEALGILRDSDSDSPTHCHRCGRLIEHGLTDTGLRYVAESVLQGFSEGKQNPVTVQWITAYGDRLPDELDDVEVSIVSALALYTWLPIAGAWFTRDDLRRQPTLAGWTEDSNASGSTAR